MDGKIWKFKNEKTAENFSNRTTKMSVIILGDDSRYWVTNGATAQKLEAAGYQIR